MKMKNLIAIFLLLSMFACTQESAEVAKAPLFEDREIIQTLTNEPGRIEYYCDGDTTFIYLSTDRADLPDLYWQLTADYMDLLGSIFNDDHFELYDPECLPVLYLSDPNIPVLVNASIVKKHDLDTFPADMEPIVLHNMKSVSCKLDSTVLPTDTFTLQSSWTIYSVTIEDSVWYPPCEFKDMRIWFSNEPFEYREYDSLGYNQLGFAGFYGCDYGYKVLNESEFDLKSGGCILGWANSTNAVVDFFGVVQDVLFHEHVAYEITNNWLRITDSKGNKIDLFRLE